MKASLAGSLPVRQPKCSRPRIGRAVSEAEAGAFDSRRERCLPRESAGVDGGLSSRVERGSKPLRGARVSRVAADGRQPVSKSGEQRSIRWRPATGMDAEGCCPALHAGRPGALPSISTKQLRCCGRMPRCQRGRASSILASCAGPEATPAMTSSTGVRRGLQNCKGPVRFRRSSPCSR